MSEASGRPGLLIVAGEPSGDRIAAAVAAQVARWGVRCFGAGGPACRRAGVETFVDVADTAAMGVGDVLARAPTIARAIARILLEIRREPPRAALLVNFTELNVHLGRRLRRRGVPVLWCVAPQVWAWRPGRLHAVQDAVDRLAVILPFEEPLWRGAGVDARYVGHPSLDALAGSPDREAARARCGVPRGARAVAVLPGSRPGEIARLGPALCAAAAQLCRDGDADEARLLLAPGLSARAEESALASARAAGLAVVRGDPEHGAAALLGAFDAALCASGTACLEAALAGAAPVITYRVDPVTYAVARRLVRTPHLGLPNILLGRRAYPELIQGEADAGRVAAAARGLLDAGAAEAGRTARELRTILEPPSPGSFGGRVAAMLEPWLRRARADLGAAAGASRLTNAVD